MKMIREWAEREAAKAARKSGVPELAMRWGCVLRTQRAGRAALGESG